ncbi:Nif3-like dinuclear metal center hexameric protein [Candidatus Shikimatogenerans silvanidophilus]|uniref:Nif3-like dinuclear metal center hexameric protein n=1 Tax=Candidatus Shikimatogenerans silvanidophilus TaxID=2782547 RepID=UPI001BA6A483|nr:Nif3-like dinuclear metal center hexameric protein [Candidatus Shikimatogenerans silvanidophilus]
MKLIKIKKIIQIIEKEFPLCYSEDFDNVGLLIGSYENIVNGILITLDITNKVIEESIYKNCNLIITFHPILFKKINKIIYENNKIIFDCIKNDISIYCIHTNLENYKNLTNKFIFNKLKLINKKILIPKKKIFKKMVTYVPNDYLEKIRYKLFEAGAGKIGNYKECSFTFKGIYSFKKKYKLNFKKETCINVIFYSHLEEKIKKTLLKYHPYTEVSYEIFNLENNVNIGNGLIGYLEKPIKDIIFLDFLKKKLSLKIIRHSKILNKKIIKISLLCGSGKFAINIAKKKKSDVFISSDFKYHDFFIKDILIIDIGHYESENYIKKNLFIFLNKKLNFYKKKIHISEINTNPIFYF